MRAFAFAAFALVCASAGAAEARTYKIAFGPQAQAQLAAAIAAIKPGDQIQFDRGRYELAAPITIASSQVTVRGAGQDKTMLSFLSQGNPGDCLTVSGAQMVLRDFAVENCKGDAIKAKGANQLIAQNLRAEWAGAKPPAASGIYPIGAQNVLIENVIVRGATFAGVRVAQSHNVVVRDTVVSGSGIGIAVENTVAADLFRNNSTHNAVGVAIYDLPGAPAGGQTRVFKSQIMANDFAPTAPASEFAGRAPAGVGVLITATRDVAITDNDIGENPGANVFLGAYRGEMNDAKFNALARNVAIRKNRFGRSGFAPSGAIAEINKAGAKPADIVWDGADTFFAGGAPRQEPVLMAIEDNKGVAGPPSFVNLGLITAGSDWTEIQPKLGPAMIANIPEVAEVKLPRGM